MAEESKQGKEKREGEAVSTLNRNFAGVLGAILDAASEMFRSSGETDIRFSVALTGEMGKDKLPQLVDELPIVADIALTKEVGTRAALLTDEPTALALASFVSGEEAPQEGALDDDTLALLRDALGRIIDALSNACQDATGYPLGVIESIETVDTADPPPMMKELSTALSERLCRATASVSIGNEDNGRLVLVVPRDLVISLIRPRPKPLDATVSRREEADLQQDEIDAIITTAGDEGREPPSEEEIAALLAQATGEPVESESASSTRAWVEPELAPKNIDLILDIRLKLTARLGKMEMSVGEIMKLSPGSIMDIGRFVDEPIELVVNDRLIARGDIVIVQENFGVKISEIVSPQERIQSLR